MVKIEFDNKSMCRISFMLVSGEKFMMDVLKSDSPYLTRFFIPQVKRLTETDVRNFSYAAKVLRNKSGHKFERGAGASKIEYNDDILHWWIDDMRVSRDKVNIYYSGGNFTPSEFNILDKLLGDARKLDYYNLTVAKLKWAQRRKAFFDRYKR